MNKEKKLTNDSLYAGIDLGTSGCRLTVIDDSKQIKFSTSISYALSEKQEPELWWNSVRKLLRELPENSKKSLVALAVDGTSGTILMTDKQGIPTSSALMYNDLRATTEGDMIQHILPLDNGGQGASGSLARLLWLLKNEPNNNHAHALHQADYILGKLANNYGLSDQNNCLKLGYNVIGQSWPEDSLIELGVDVNLLPDVFPAGTPVSSIDKEMANLLALPETLQLVSGTTDSIAAFIATGASNTGEAVTSLGSTLVLKLIADKPIFSPQYGIYSHRLGEHWLVGGASNSGAKVLQHFFTQGQIDEMTALLTPRKATGLNYYPLLQAGERFPVADANKQPVLSPRPESDLDFFQGILEGIASIEAQAYAKLEALGTPSVTSVRTVGGGAKNSAWTQIRQQQLNVSMITPQHTEAAYGSALLALGGSRHINKRLS